jgi:hypothetical protein
MNSFTKLTSRNFTRLTACAVLTFGALLLNSCSKDPEPAQPYAFLSITNTSPTLATFNIYIDQNPGKVNVQGALAFGGSLGYGQIASGAHSVKVTTASSTESLLTKNISLDENAAYSLFIIDKNANMDYLVTKDALGDISSAKAFVKFINLSPDAAALDLGVKDASVIISDKAYKASSAFIEVEAKAYVFQIKDKATGNVKKELASLDAKAGKSYTVIATGLIAPSGTDQPFTGQIITNQ